MARVVEGKVRKRDYPELKAAFIKNDDGTAEFQFRIIGIASFDEAIKLLEYMKKPISHSLEDFYDLANGAMIVDNGTMQ